MGDLAQKGTHAHPCGSRDGGISSARDYQETYSDGRRRVFRVGDEICDGCLGVNPSHYLAVAGKSDGVKGEAGEMVSAIVSLVVRKEGPTGISNVLLGTAPK